MNPAVFIDRDGTIIKEKSYISDPEQVEILPNSVSALKLLTENGFKLFVVTNQSGVGRGFFSLEELHAVHDRLSSLLEAAGTAVNKIYFCPHRPDEGCECRKPKPGMVMRAKNEFDIDLTRSYMIGDRSEDIELGAAAGLKAVLVLTGYGSHIAALGDCPKTQETIAKTPVVGQTFRFASLPDTGEILSDHGKDTLRPVTPDHIAKDLLEAANWICRRE
jgi:histidinol-phosphate phosphatase family protein